MMRPDAKVQKVYLYPKPVDFRKSINGLAALVELDIKVEVFNPVLFVFLNRTRSQVKILYWERNGFCLWLKRLEAERFKTKPDAGDIMIAEMLQPTARTLLAFGGANIHGFIAQPRGDVERGVRDVALNDPRGHAGIRQPRGNPLLPRLVALVYPRSENVCGAPWVEVLHSLRYDKLTCSI